MSTSNSCKDDASKSNCECEVNDMLQNMSVVDNEVNIVSVCANCGKEGNDINNLCNKCKQVKYCNAACKKKHRSKHKKACEEHQRLAAEHAAELHDERLFKQPPPKEDCPICFLRMPSLCTGRNYMTCCGKVICCGCIHAIDEIDEEEKCPFCRVPAPEDEEMAEREKKRVEAGDVIAIHYLANNYRDGTYGFPQNYKKALELWHRAGELGYADAYCSIGNAYDRGQGVEVDKKKSVHYFELSAVRGCEVARKNLGCIEECAGNIDRALRHHMISVRSGYTGSLDIIKELYTYGHATTKEDYMKALQLYQEYLDEIKSPQRDKAAAADEKCRYY